MSLCPTQRGEDVKYALVRANLDGVSFVGRVPIVAPNYLIEGTLPKGGVVFLGGQSGAGRTFIECQIATCLATGEDFFGRAVKERVGVVIMAAEGESTLANRLEAARRERDAAQFLPIAWRGAIADLFNDQERAALLSQLRLVDEHFKNAFDVRLGCIFVDTMAQAFGFTDENSNAETSRALVDAGDLSRPRRPGHPGAPLRRVERLRPPRCLRISREC